MVLRSLLMCLERKLILVVRECVSSYIITSLLENERQQSLRDALIRLLTDCHPLDGPPAVVRCDAGPGFAALQDDQIFNKYQLVIEIGHIKNKNKNPVAEKDGPPAAVRCDAGPGFAAL